MSFSYRLSAALIAATIAIVQPEFAVAQLSAQQVEEIRRNECNQSGAIDFNEAIRLNPKDAEAYNGRGAVRYDQGDIEGAIADYNEA
ncbi:MAG: tetratricopeptide repeat protein, partial [Microcoleus sp. T3-bin5]|nr:tetratricopeptide repeat protein [Microcoleus sp. T3-bin5]